MPSTVESCCGIEVVSAVMICCGVNSFGFSSIGREEDVSEDLSSGFSEVFSGAFLPPDLLGSVFCCAASGGKAASAPRIIAVKNNRIIVMLLRTGMVKGTMDGTIAQRNVQKVGIVQYGRAQYTQKSRATAGSPAFL